jgi:drug/metabolite transporter (DMT)-like permease
MPMRQRITGSVGLLILGGVAALFLGGTAVTRCLGPLGRTLVDSVRDGCITPTVGFGGAIAAAAVVAAVLNLEPAVAERMQEKLLGALVGVVAGVVAYLAVRPTSVTGPTMTGEVITVALPFDWWALVVAAILGGGVGWLLGRWLRQPEVVRAT